MTADEQYAEGFAKGEALRAKHKRWKRSPLVMPDPHRIKTMFAWGFWEGYTPRSEEWALPATQSLKPLKVSRLARQPSAKSRGQKIRAAILARMHEDAGPVTSAVVAERHGLTERAASRHLSILREEEHLMMRRKGQSWTWEILLYRDRRLPMPSEYVQASSIWAAAMRMSFGQVGMDRAPMHTGGAT